MKIGVFDSGVGGISVLHHALRMLDTPEYLYYADVQHAPYGTKDASAIRDYACAITDFLIEKGCEAVVIACNTATSAAVEILRARTSIPIIGMEPAVKPALGVETSGKRRRVLVLATPLTLKEHKLEDLLKRFDDAHRVDLLALPALVPFAEKQLFEGEEVTAYLREAFAKTDTSQYAAVVTGCTHFLFFLPALRALFAPGTVFVDGAEGTVRRLADVCNLRIRTEKEQVKEADFSRVRWFFSGEEVTDAQRRASIAVWQRRLNAIGI